MSRSTSTVTPLGWVIATIPDLIAGGIFTDGDWVESKDQDANGNVRLIQLADVGDGYFVDKSSRFMNAQTAENLRCTFLKKNDLLIARMPDPLGRACLMPNISQKSVTVVDVCVVRDKPENFSATWLMYFINSSIFRNKISALQSGSTRKRISRGNLSKIDLPIPPRKEQTRIVEKLEELLTDLDNGVAELKAAQAKLGQYRQSLLKSAIEGSLTADWREANAHTITETGEQLLQRILTERREHWEAQKLAEFEAKGKKPPKDWQKRYPEPVHPDTSDLPELPEGWCWASIAQVASNRPYSLAIGPFGSNLKVSDYTDKGVPLVFVRNIKSGNYGGEFTKHITSKKALELSAHTASAGDVVVTKMGEPPGDADILPDNQPQSVITADCIKISPNSDLVLADFLKVSINSWIGKKQILSITKGVAQKKVSLGRFSNVAVPIAPLAEQKAIVEVFLQSQENAYMELNATAIGLAQAAAQRKNILQDAFSGKLVEQDPNDEPASVLLTRIQAEREALAKQPKPKRPKKKATKVMTMETLKDALLAQDDWADAQQLFRDCGVVDGTDADRIEELYAELRELDRLEIKREGDYDLLRLKGD